jgi:AhpD family alkylhydroperoxidase
MSCITLMCFSTGYVRKKEDDMQLKFTQQRLDAMKASPGAFNAMMALQTYVNGSGLERPLLELVKIRASRINGCAFCLAMHTRDARKLGESDERMQLLDAWHEAPVFSARERAALAWTETVTLISDDHVPDEIYDEARRQFSENELVDLTVAVVAINGWNRAAIAFRTTPQIASSTKAA